MASVPARARDGRQRVGVGLGLRALAIAADRRQRGQPGPRPQDRRARRAQRAGALVGHRFGVARPGSAERVAADDVGHLAPQDQRELRLALDGGEQPRVHDEPPVRPRERVQRRIADDADLQLRAPRRARGVGHELSRQPREVVDQRRIVVAPHPLEDRGGFLLPSTPQPALIAVRNEPPPLPPYRHHPRRTPQHRNRHEDDPQPPPDLLAAPADGLLECGDVRDGARQPSARLHGEPLSPFERRARRASRQRIDWPAAQPPLGDGGPERVGSGASYGDRRAMLAR
jgi:hypothetical protein